VARKRCLKGEAEDKYSTTWHKTLLGEVLGGTVRVNLRGGIRNRLGHPGEGSGNLTLTSY